MYYGLNPTNKEEKTMFTRSLKKAWYEIYKIEVKDGKPEVVTEEVETLFPERWEKKNVKANFIKKNEATYKMSIPEAKLIEYAFENGYIKEEPEND